MNLIAVQRNKLLYPILGLIHQINEKVSIEMYKYLTLTNLEVLVFNSALFKFRKQYSGQNL